jgi:hypothetical protein
MLLLVADKGIAHEEDLALAPRTPSLDFHAGGRCFSQLVNFDAIGKYFCGKGGQALLPSKHFTSLNLCAFIQRNPGDNFPPLTMHTSRRYLRSARTIFSPS